jgi:hypothetical protein
MPAPLTAVAAVLHAFGRAPAGTAKLPELIAPAPGMLMPVQSSEPILLFARRRSLFFKKFGGTV